MRVGICCSGIGPTSDAAFVTVSAQAAEEEGFSTIWVGEHVVLFDRYPESRYPYGGMFGSDVPVPDPTTPITDPVVTLTWIAAVTRHIEVGSGIIILPQRQPLVLAKALSTLDALSGGRLVFGAGVGWCKEEYDAVGAPWVGRGERMDEYLQAIRVLWRDKRSTFRGNTTEFRDAYLYPKPARDIPVMIGGESDFALKRAARYGDGWFAFKLSVEDAPQKVKRLHELAREQGRDPADLRVVVAIFSHTKPDDLRRYRDAGVTEFNLVTAGALPLDESGLRAGIGSLRKRFVDIAAAL